MGRVIAITNQKGGSGKTTTAVNLAATLGELKRRVLLVDLDPQASASNWYGIAEEGKGLFEAFTESKNLKNLLQSTCVPRVEMIPSSSWLVGVDKALAGEVGAEMILNRHLAHLSDQWDYILLDCSPTLGIVTINALVAAREILIPVETHVMALRGLAHLLQTVETIRVRLNSDLAISGILACRVDARTRHALDVVAQLRERFGKQVFKVVVRESIRLAECPSFGKPVTLYDPQGNGAKDYRALAKEVIKQERV
ncbi:MAG: sporulation initiation inhibitor protein Soj [Nitrospirales bacterium]|nr:MAG: sporulation initiation inhibitor protein Soj [Nitrospirales bacterium]